MVADRSGWTRRALVAACVVSLIGLGLVRSSVGFPLILDQSFFLPISFYYAHTGVVQLPWWAPFPTDYLNWHGFVQPILIAALSPGSTWSDLYIGVGVLSCLTFLVGIGAAAVLKVDRTHALGLAIILFGLELDFRARPELLACAIVIALVLVSDRAVRHGLRDRVSAALTGALLALLLYTHPAIFVLSVLAYGVFAASALATGETTVADFARAAAWSAGAALLTSFVCVHLLYGHSEVQYLTGIRRHAAAIVSRSDRGRFVQIYLANRYTPLLIAAFVPIAVGSVLLWRRLGAGEVVKPWKMVAGLLLGAFLLALYWTAVRVPSTYYNLCGILPAVWLLAVSPRLQSWLDRSSRSISAWSRFALATMTVATLFAQFAWMVQTADEGRSARNNRQDIGVVVQEALRRREHVCADFPVVSGTPNLVTAMTVDYLPITVDISRTPDRGVCDLFIAFSQEPRDREAPPVAGFTLVDDRFKRHRLLAMLRPTDFGFAVYRRTVVDAPSR